MEPSARVAALASALGLAACTTLLGVDGDYDAGPDGAGGATSSASTTDVATQAGSTADAASVGGGSTTSSTSGGGEGCPLCVFDPRSSEANGSRPRLSSPSPLLRYTFLRGDTVQERTALATQPEYEAPGVIDATFATGAGDETRLLWLANPGEDGTAELHGATTGPVAVWGDHFEATLTGSGAYVATHQPDGQPVLFFCDEAGCTPNFDCGDGTLHGARDVALVRIGEAIAYARRCDGDLVLSVTPSTTDVLRIENLPFDQLAVGLRPGEVPVVATVSGSGTSAARVQVLTRDDVASPVDIAFARLPTMVSTDDGTLVVVQVSDGSEDTPTLGAVFCGPLLSDGCARVDLTGIELAGASKPSLGLVGDADVWLTFEQDGNVVVGQLGP